MSSFGGVRFKTSSKSSKKLKKTKLTERGNENEEEKDAEPSEKQEHVEDETISQHPRRREEEEEKEETMPADASNAMADLTTSLGNLNDLRNSSDLEQKIYNIPLPENYEPPNDENENLNGSGNNSKCNQKETESDCKDINFKAIIRNVVNVTMEKLYDKIKDCILTSSASPIFKEVEETAEYLVLISRKYGKLSPLASDSPPASCPGPSVEKTHPVEQVGDGNEHSSKVSKQKTKLCKDKTMDIKEDEMQVESVEKDVIPAFLEEGDEIPTVLEEDDEMMEMLNSNKIPPPSYRLQNRREISSPPSPSLTNTTKTLPDPIEHVDDQDKSTSKGSQNRSKRGQNEINEDEIPVVIEEKNEIQTVLEEKAEIPTVLEREIFTVLEEDETLEVMEGGGMPTVLEEDEIPAVLQKKEEIPAVLEKNDEISTALQKKDEISAVLRKKHEISVLLRKKDEISALLWKTKEISALLEKNHKISGVLPKNDIIYALLQKIDEILLQKREEISAVLEKKDELMEVFHKDSVPRLSDHFYNSKKEEMSSAIPSSSFPSTSLVKTIPHRIKSTDKQNKISSKSKKKKSGKSKRGGTKIMECDEIPVALEGRSKIPVVFDRSDEIPTVLGTVGILAEDEGEILAMRTGEGEVATTLEDDEISAVLEEREEFSAVLEKKDKIPAVLEEKDKIPAPLEEKDKIPAVLEEKDKIPAVFDKEEKIPAVFAVEDELMEGFPNKRIPPPSHYSPNSEKRERTSPTPRTASPLPSTSFDKTQLDLTKTADKQDKTSSKGYKKKSSKLGKKEKIEDKEEMKEVFGNNLVSPLSSGSSIPLYGDNIDNDGKNDVISSNKEQNDFPSIQYDFSKSVLMWNRWSLISIETICNIIKEIPDRYELYVNRSNLSSEWCYAIFTFNDLQHVESFVKIFKAFKANLQPSVEKMKLLMNREQRIFSESMTFKDPEPLVLTETVSTWLRHIKIMGIQNPTFADQYKTVSVKNINPKVTYEELRNKFSVFGEIISIKLFPVLKSDCSLNAEITFSHLFEAFAAVFAMESCTWFQYKLSVTIGLKFRYFGDWIERHFYPEVSNSVSFSDIFAIMRINKLHELKRESHSSREYKEETHVGVKSVSTEKCATDKDERLLNFNVNTAEVCKEESEPCVTSGMKKRVQSIGKGHLQFSLRNGTSNEGKSQQNGAKSKPVKKSKKRGKKKKRR